MSAAARPEPGAILTDRQIEAVARKVRGPSKKTREALDAAYKRGFDDCLKRDRAPDGLGFGLALLVWTALAVAAGAHFF